MQIRTLLFSVLFFSGIASVQAQVNLSLQGIVQKSTGVYAAGERNFSEANLSGAELHEAINSLPPLSVGVFELRCVNFAAHFFVHKNVPFRSFRMLVFHILIPLTGKNHLKFLSGRGLLKLWETNLYRQFHCPSTGVCCHCAHFCSNSSGI